MIACHHKTSKAPALPHCFALFHLPATHKLSLVFPLKRSAVSVSHSSDPHSII